MSNLIQYLDKAKKEGLKGGQTGNPPPHAESPDANEVGYIVAAQKLFNVEKEKFYKAKAEIDKKIHNASSELDELESEISMMNGVENLEEMVSSRLDESSNKHKAVIKDFLLKEASLKTFKIVNNIHREAHYPGDFHSHFSWIFLILAIESVANAYFFSANTGLAQGAIIALAFSFINVSIGVIAGLAFRFKNSNDQAQKIFGWLAIFIGVLLLVWINSTTATARSLTELAKSQNLPIMDGELWMRALSDGVKIFTLDIPFKDQNGFLLFFVGLISAGISIWKGYTSLDEIPGYTQPDKLVKSAQRDKEAIEKECVLLAQKSAKEERDKRDKAKREIQKVIATMGRIASEFKQSCVILNAKKCEIQSDFKQLIVAYRNSVRAVTPVGVPGYFHEEPNAELEINEYEIQETNQKIEELTARANGLQTSYGPILQEQIVAIDGSRAMVMAKINDFFQKSKDEAREELGDAIHVINMKVGAHE
ncbi:hypothetical protein G6656_00485 [Polynucleobacter paneuropaeus]|nr:hypothetical protein [Polynucleobacter paneuropaeus]